jgi:hypothetical protein
MKTTINTPDKNPDRSPDKSPDKNPGKSRYLPTGTAPLIAAVALAMPLMTLQAQAEITEDCILEGTVDMHTARELGQSVYVKFSNARRGSEAGCSMNRRNSSRRVQFISAPSAKALQDVDVKHGDAVTYRYIERNNQRGHWELVDIGS